MSLFILVTEIKPSCRFFGNVNVGFGKADPAVIDECVEIVRRGSPKWIIYNVTKEEFTGGEMNYFKQNFSRHRNAKVEKILDEKYILNRVIPTGYIGLYRLREEQREVK